LSRESETVLYDTEGEANRNSLLGNQDPAKVITAATFADLASANRAIEALKERDFSPEVIGFALLTPNESYDLEGRRLAENERKLEHAAPHEVIASATKGATAGAFKGAILGAVAGVVLMLLFTLLPLAGSAILNNLPFMLFLAIVTGALVGAIALSIMDALGKVGLAEEGKRFDSGQPNGPILVTVKAGERTAEVIQLLQAYGGDTSNAGQISSGAPAAEAIKRANNIP
jgi:hypothetical protein